MELLTGGELIEKLIKENRVLDEVVAAELFEKLLKALNHCHSLDILHRDIKPENIMYDAEGNIKFIDFGFAIISEKKKADLNRCGTPYYIAPEVLLGGYG